MSKLRNHDQETRRQEASRGGRCAVAAGTTGATRDMSLLLVSNPARVMVPAPTRNHGPRGVSILACALFILAACGDDSTREPMPDAEVLPVPISIEASPLPLGLAKAPVPTLPREPLYTFTFDTDDEMSYGPIIDRGDGICGYVDFNAYGYVALNSGYSRPYSGARLFTSQLVRIADRPRFDAWVWTAVRNGDRITIGFEEDADFGFVIDPAAFEPSSYWVRVGTTNGPFEVDTGFVAREGFEHHLWYEVLDSGRVAYGITEVHSGRTVTGVVTPPDSIDGSGQAQRFWAEVSTTNDWPAFLTIDKVVISMPRWTP